jgi:hypothetical protein
MKKKKKTQTNIGEKGNDKNKPHTNSNTWGFYIFTHIYYESLAKPLRKEIWISKKYYYGLEFLNLVPFKFY